MDDTRNTITNFQGTFWVLSRPNLDDFARVICSTDCSNIYMEGNGRGHEVGLRSAGEGGLLQMNLRSVEGEEERDFKPSSGGSR